MSTKNINFNDLDRPDPIVSPQRDPIGYDDGRRMQPAQRRARVPFSIFMLMAAAVLLIVGFVLWRVSAWLSSEYAYNPTFSAIVQFSLYAVILALAIFVVGSLLALLFGVFGWSFKHHLAELPGGLPVAAFDVLMGWRRDHAANMASGMMNRHYDVQHMLAQQSQFRNVTAYSPSISTSYNNKQDAAQLPGGDTHPALLPSGDVPPFDALLEAGMIGPGPDGRAQPLIFGYDAGTGEPLTGDWRQLYSVGLGGLQGSGKTWTAAYLLSQSAMSGAQIMICDIHADDSESLASRVQPLAPSFVCDTADDERSVLEALKYAESVLKARRAGDSDRRPLIVAVDEFSALRRGELADKLPSIIESFSTEGRKLQCHVMLLAQRWDKASVGSFRNTLASSFVHRLRADEARMLTGLRAELLPKDTLQLPPGHCYLLDTYGLIHRVAIPRMSMASMQRVGERLQTGYRVATNANHFGFRVPNKTPATVASCKPDGSQMVANNNQATTAAGRDEKPAAEAIHAARLFFAGDDPATIVFKLRGIKSSEGRKYQTALAEILELIRQGAAVGA